MVSSIKDILSSTHIWKRWSLEALAIMFREFMDRLGSEGKIMDWLGAFLCLTGFYFFSSKHPWGYVMYVLGELSYIVWALYAYPVGWGLIFVCSVFIVLGIRDYYNRRI